MKYFAIFLLFIGIRATTEAAQMKPLSKSTGHREAAVEAQLPDLTLDEQTPKTHNGLTAIGVGRRVPARAFDRGKWTTLATGERVWRVAIRSPKAWGLRLHFTDFNVGSGRVWLYANNSNSAEAGFVGPYTGQGLFGDGDFWSEPVEGGSVVIEYAAAEDAPADAEIPFRLAEISHFFSKPLAKGSPRVSLDVITSGPADSELGALAATDNTATAQTSCSPDVTCYSQWSTAASAVASITFVSGSSSYICTGSLIEDNAKSGQPLFLTADHCIPDDATARTVVAHFQYQSSVCNGALPSYSEVPKVAGAKYLISRPIPAGDFSLMLLSAAAPAGTTFLSWSGATDPQLSEAVVGIHHPGVLPDASAPTGTRISFGRRSYASNASVEGEIMPAAVNINVSWSPGQGYTEPGSSGSPLLNGTGKLVGTLTGGAEGPATIACRPSYAVAVYGRFSAALNTLAPYLSGSTTPAPSTPPAGPSQSCVYSFAQPNISIPAIGGSGIVGVTMTPGCGMPAMTTAPWLSASGTVAGTGNGSVTFFASWNASQLPRPAAIQSGNEAVQILQKSASTQQSYTDVSADYPFFDYIAILRGAGIINGCSATQFCPDQPMNRADMAVFLVRAVVGTDVFSYTPQPYFTDVPASSPYFPYVQKLKDLGITSGCTAALYCPGYPVSRLHMAKFLVAAKAGENFSYTQQPYFDDVPASDPFFKYVQKMRDLGITSGCGTRTYCANDSNTRGQMSVFLTRIFLSGVKF